MKILKAPATEIEVNIFRRSNNIYLDLGKEQYKLPLDKILQLEDLDKRTSTTT